VILRWYFTLFNGDTISNAMQLHLNVLDWCLSFVMWESVAGSLVVFWFVWLFLVPFPCLPFQLLGIKSIVGFFLFFVLVQLTGLSCYMLTIVPCNEKHLNPNIDFTSPFHVLFLKSISYEFWTCNVLGQEPYMFCNRINLNNKWAACVVALLFQQSQCLTFFHAS
jgi:hypothetical protein